MKYKPKAEHTSEKTSAVPVSYFIHKPKHTIRQTPEGDSLLPDFSFPWGVLGGRVLKRNSPQDILISSSHVSLQMGGTSETSGDTHCFQPM